MYGTPMLFGVFVVNKNEIKITYMQNFSTEGITYRSSAAGIYSNQVDIEGNSFITVRVPGIERSSKRFFEEEYSQNIWKEVKKLKIVSESKTHQIKDNSN